MRTLTQRTMMIAAAFVAASQVPTPAAAQKVQVTVDCTATDLDGAEKEQCASPDLIQLAASVDSATRALEARFTGRNKEMLLDTEKPVRTERNDCQNHLLTDVHRCVADVLTRRLHGLAEASASPDDIRHELTQYTFFDVPYVLKWGELLTKNVIHVWGCLRTMTGTTVIVSARCSKETPYLRTVYSDVQGGPAKDLRDQPRTGYWRGTLRQGAVLVFQP